MAEPRPNLRPGLRPTHELHSRRFGRNLGVGLVLAGFVAVIFALTVVKVTRGDPMQGYDHVVQPTSEPAPEPAPAAAPATQPGTTP